MRWQPCLHPIKTNPNPRLYILIENKGRCCGDLPDFGCNFKGMKDKPLFGLKELSNWTINKLPMDIHFFVRIIGDMVL